jgi:hypothetical protein
MRLPRRLAAPRNDHGRRERFIFSCGSATPVGGLEGALFHPGRLLGRGSGIAGSPAAAEPARPEAVCSDDFLPNLTWACGVNGLTNFRAHLASLGQEPAAEAGDADRKKC